MLCTCQVLDVAGLSAVAMLSHARSEENKAEWQHNTEYYPETLGKIIVINAPFGIGAVWKFASRVVGERTRSKVSIHGSTG